MRAAIPDHRFDGRAAIVTEEGCAVAAPRRWQPRRAGVRRQPRPNAEVALRIRRSADTPRLPHLERTQRVIINVSTAHGHRPRRARPLRRQQGPAGRLTRSWARKVATTLRSGSASSRLDPPTPGRPFHPASRRPKTEPSLTERLRSSPSPRATRRSPRADPAPRRPGRSVRSRPGPDVDGSLSLGVLTRLDVPATTRNTELRT
jgi:hypothetical protein